MPCPLTPSGKDSVLLSPWAEAASANCAQRSSSATESVRQTCCVRKASRQGPRPVLYWTESTAGAVSSVKMAVLSRPSTSKVIPTLSAPGMVWHARSATRVRASSSVVSPTKNLDSVRRLSPRASE
jgi:hypothetical protein